jgi:hypothetical protein
MIITYDNTQSAVNTSAATQELSLVSLETTITNITNKSFTVNLQITLNDSNVNVTRYGFLVSISGVSLPEIDFSHTNTIGQDVYTYSYRLKDLISSQTYNILPYVTIDGNRTYDIQQQDVLTIIPASLSSHTDMSYADVRDLDLSSKGLNMSIVNFDNCLVNENTIFSKNIAGLDIKHYYDYDLTNGFNFSVENADNPNYDFVSLLNSYSDDTVKNNLKLVRIKQLFRNREPQNMILVNKKFLGLVDTPTFYYSTYIGVLNPNINNFYLNDYMYPNEFTSEFCYKLITTNFTLNNHLNIVLNQNINEDEAGFRIIQKNNEFLWIRKITVYIECMTDTRLAGNNLMFEVSFTSNLVDLYTDDLTFAVNISNGDSVTVPFNKTNKSYFNYIPLNAGTFSLSINNNSFTRYQDVFDFTSTSYSTIIVSENPNPVPVINGMYTNITNRSVTLGCDLLLSGNKIISEIGIYVSTTLPKRGTLYLIEEPNLNTIKQYTRRIYPLLSNTTYYVIVYLKCSDGSTIETQPFEFTTKTDAFDISGLTDLSYADLTTISLFSISESVNLTGAIISTNTVFPLGKQYFDYPQTVLDELLSTKGTNNNNNKFIGVNNTDKNKLRKFLIKQYFTYNNNINKSDFGIVSNKFLGIEDDAITPTIKIVNQDTQRLSISETGPLKETVLYKHMDENDEFEIVDGANVLKIQGPVGVTGEYFFYKNDVLIPKLNGIYTSGSVVDCFSSFNMLNGYIITLNSVEVSEYIYATLSRTGQTYGNTITYTITLDAVTTHDLTFTLSDGSQIIVPTGYTTGSVNKQSFAIQTVSITTVTGGQSNRVRTSGTVICNNIPYISTVYKDVTDRSITLGCNLEYIAMYNNVDISIYISKDSTKIKNATVTDNGDFSKSKINSLKSTITFSSTGIGGFRVYGLTPDTTYYIMSSVTYPVDIIKADHTDYTNVQTFTTLASNSSNLLNVSDLSYTDLSTHTDLSSIPLTSNLTNTVVNVKNTNFPVGKKFFDYPIRIKELINATPNTDNSSLIALDLNPTNQETIRKMIIDQYLSDNNTEMIDVSDKFLGFNDVNKRSNMTILKNSVQSIELSKLGNLQEKTMYKHMDENSVFEIKECSTKYLDSDFEIAEIHTVSLKITGPVNGVYEVAKIENTTTSSTSSSSSSTSSSELPAMGIATQSSSLFFNKGDTIDCFSVFQILKGHTITFNSVELSKYKNAVLTGSIVQFNDDGSPAQNKIRYTITLDRSNSHNLTFTLTDGTTILIQSGNTVGTEIASISYGTTVSISSVSGGLSNFVHTSGTVTITTEVIYDNYLISEEHTFENVFISMQNPDVEVNWPNGTTSNDGIVYLEEYTDKFNTKVPFYGRYCLTDINTVTGPTNVFNYTTDTNDIRGSVYSMNTTSPAGPATATIQIDIRDGVPTGPVIVSATVSGVVAGVVVTGTVSSDPSLYYLSGLTPNTQYNYIATMLVTPMLSKTCSGSFKTNPTEVVFDQTLINNTDPNKIKQSVTTLKINSNYTMTNNTKTVNNFYKCITSNPLSTASDVIIWKGSFEVGRYYENQFQYPIQNKILEFDVISSSGIYKNMKKVKMHFVDRIDETDETGKYYHMFEILP